MRGSYFSFLLSGVRSLIFASGTLAPRNLPGTPEPTQDHVVFALAQQQSERYDGTNVGIESFILSPMLAVIFVLSDPSAIFCRTLPVSASGTCSMTSATVQEMKSLLTLELLHNDTQEGLGAATFSTTPSLSI